MPVSIVSTMWSVSCSWYSSTSAACGLEPSPGLPITGSNFDISSMTNMGPGLFGLPDSSMPNRSRSAGIFCAICQAGRNTSSACFSLVAPEYTSAPASPSAANRNRPRADSRIDFPFLRGISSYENRNRRRPESFRTQPNRLHSMKHCHGWNTRRSFLADQRPFVWGISCMNFTARSAFSASYRYGQSLRFRSSTNRWQASRAYLPAATFPASTSFAYFLAASVGVMA